jgi:hypothetical protein
LGGFWFMPEHGISPPLQAVPSLALGASWRNQENHSNCVRGCGYLALEQRGEILPQSEQMKRRNPIIVLAALLVLIPFVLTRHKPEARVANRIRNQYNATEAALTGLGPDASWEQVDHFLGKLKGIDTTDAPREVQDSYAALLVAVEANANTRRTHGDTNAANERVATAKRNFVSTLERWRGQPF